MLLIAVIISTGNCAIEYLQRFFTFVSGKRGVPGVFWSENCFSFYTGGKDCDTTFCLAFHVASGIIIITSETASSLRQSRSVLPRKTSAWLSKREGIA